MPDINRSETIAAFLALLELLRLKQISIQQDGAFSPHLYYRTKGDRSWRYRNWDSLKPCFSPLVTPLSLDRDSQCASSFAE